MSSYKFVINNILIQLIPMVSIFGFSFIYDPDAFGDYYLILSISLVISSVGSLRLEQSIIRENDNEKVENLIDLSLILLIISSLLTLILVVINFNLIYVTFLVLFVGAFNIRQLIFLRNGDLKSLNFLSLKRNGFTAVFQFVFFFFAPKIGLILGNLIGYFFGLVLFVIERIKNIQWESFVKSLKQLFEENIDLYKYSTVSTLLSNGTLQGISIIISTMFGSYYLGIFAFIERIAGAPTSLVGAPISKLYFKDLAESLRNKNKLTNVFFKYLLILLFISILLFLPLYLFSGYFILNFLSSEWKEVTIYLPPLIGLYSIRLISSNLSTTLIVLNLESKSLFINILLLINLITISTIVLVNNIDFYYFVKSYSLTSSILYLLFLCYYFYLIKSYDEEHIK